MLHHLQTTRCHRLWQTVCTGLTLTVLTAPAAAAPAQEPEAFLLNPIMVTAQRYEKDDLNIPAMTEIVTQTQLQATGATTVIEAIKFATGMIYHAQGPAGISQGGHTSKAIIRGQTKGTLVLLNGLPLNLRGSYNLETIPVQDVERVEIVRGGGAVLYGSDATGGVINIITKKERETSVYLTAGNYDKQKHGVSFQSGKLGFGYHYDKLGELDRISAPYSRTATGKRSYFDFLGSEAHSFSYQYRFDDHWTFLYTYNENDSYYRYNFEHKADGINYDTDYAMRNNRIQVMYKNDGWQAGAYLNYRRLDSRQLKYGATNTLTHTDTKDQLFGFDVQREWRLGPDNLLVGLGLQEESYEQEELAGANPQKKYNVSRNVYSLLAQWNHPFNAQTDITVAVRETWTGGAPDGKNYDEFTPQLQLLHKVDDRTSWYASAGKSFTMPTFAQIYGSGISVTGNPNVKPETGRHYETGLKRIDGNHSWKLAVFNSDVKNNITAKRTEEPFTYENEDSKNTGIELSCEIAAPSGWSSSWGITYSNPKVKTIDENGVDSGWQRNYGRIQLNGGVRYQQKKLQAGLQANYLGKRQASANQPIRPLLMSGLNVSYKPESDKEIFLNANNLFDRRDITTHASSRYYMMPFNFELGYRLRF